MKQYMDDCGNIMSVHNVKVMSTNIYCRFISAQLLGNVCAVFTSLTEINPTYWQLLCDCKV